MSKFYTNFLYFFNGLLKIIYYIEKMKLYKLLNALSLNFSLKFLYARLPVSYVIFNKIFNKRIINANIENKKLREFNENGFVKLDINFENEIDFLKKNIKCLNPNDKKQLFEINDNIK